uniref:Uncharacterized protein n=1 Tax=Salix viminalis TaxID=40686 RepID=A0A6N2KIG7_SALVM
MALPFPQTSPTRAASSGASGKPKAAPPSIDQQLTTIAFISADQVPSLKEKDGREKLQQETHSSTSNLVWSNTKLFMQTVVYSTIIYKDKLQDDVSALRSCATWRSGKEWRVCRLDYYPTVGKSDPPNHSTVEQNRKSYQLQHLTAG